MTKKCYRKAENMLSRNQLSLIHKSKLSVPTPQKHHQMHALMRQRKHTSTKAESAFAADSRSGFFDDTATRWRVPATSTLQPFWVLAARVGKGSHSPLRR